MEEGHSALGAVLLHLNIYPEAIAELQRLKVIAPLEAQVFFLAGKVWLVGG